MQLRPTYGSHSIPALTRKLTVDYIEMFAGDFRTGKGNSSRSSRKFKIRSSDVRRRDERRRETEVVSRRSRTERNAKSRLPESMTTAIKETSN